MTTCSFSNPFPIFTVKVSNLSYFLFTIMINENKVVMKIKVKDIMTPYPVTLPRTDGWRGGQNFRAAAI